MVQGGRLYRCLLTTNFYFLDLNGEETMNGYQGKLLVADLTKGTLIDEPLNERYARDFIGSTSLAARYLFDMVDKKTDPLGPDNPLILMPGLLNGTSGPRG